MYDCLRTLSDRCLRKITLTSDLKGGPWKDCTYLSSCAKRDLWQSPKSKPQIFTFLSAEPVAMSAPSYGKR